MNCFTNKDIQADFSSCSHRMYDMKHSVIQGKTRTWGERHCLWERQQNGNLLWDICFRAN